MTQKKYVIPALGMLVLPMRLQGPFSIVFREA